MSNPSNIVRQRLKTSTHSAGDHPDPDLLAAFAEQSLPDRERTPLLEHLARCADCRDVLALSMPPLESSARGIKDTAPAQNAPWFSWPVLRWGTLAACVLIVGAAVLLRQAPPKKYLSQDIAPEPAKAASIPQPSQTDAHLVADNAGDGVTRSRRAEAKQIVTGSAQTKDKKDEKESLASLRPAPAAPPVSLALSGRASNSAPARELDKGLGDHESAFEFRTAAGAGTAVANIAPQPPPSVAGPAPKDDVKNLPLNGRNDEPLQAAKTNELVEPQAAAQSVEANSVDISPKVESPGRAKPAGAGNPTVRVETAEADQSGAFAAKTAAKTKERSLLRRAEFMTRWTISSAGQLQRSLDSGKSWQPITVADHASFRALSANGPDLWVGGTAGLLYHSTDAGAHWMQVKPATGTATLTADIAAIEFIDPQHGKITTANGEVWLTTDAGQAWQKRD
jgi:hypothetical protein